MTESSLALRPVAPGDQPFLYQVYVSTRQEQLSSANWEDAQIGSLLAMQFEAQHKHYQEHFPTAEFQIIQHDNVPIGRLYLDRRSEEFRLIDIALLPQWRGKGIGSFLIKQIMGEAKQAGLPIRIHVERFNPALRLYQRLGFRSIDEDGVHYFMEWQPD